MSNWLVLHDPDQGHSAQVDYFAEALALALKQDVGTMAVTSGTETEVDADGIVLWCALRWYETHRYSIKGHPWIGALSWCFDDLMSVIADRAIPSINLIDAGLDSLWTNCAAYVERISSAYKCSFNMEPYQPSHVSHRDRYRIGAILPNVVDRDFSQLLWTVKHLKYVTTTDAYASNGFRIFMREHEPMALPRDLVEAMPASHFGYIDNDEDLEAAYRELFYVVVPPRITDLRGGVADIGIYHALAAGCRPLVIQHPVLAKQLEGLFTIKSMTQYTGLLSDLIRDSHGPSDTTFAAGGWGAPVVQPDTHAALAWKVAQAYKEAKHASAK